MSTTVTEWIEGHSDRVLARQRAQADAAKLLATFSTGVAAALVATGLQVGQPSDWDRRATWILLASGLLAIVVALLDRMKEADLELTLAESQIQGWTEDELVRELRLATLQATYGNAVLLRWVRTALVVQICVSLLDGIAAAQSLLG